MWVVGVGVVWGRGYGCGNGWGFGVKGDGGKYVGCWVWVEVVCVDVREN